MRESNSGGQAASPRSPEGKEHYTAVAMALHWAIALVVLFQLSLGWRMSGEDGPPASALLGVHKSIGVTLLVLMLARLAWRIRHAPPPADPALSTLDRRLSAVVHHAFYWVLIALPLSGWAATAASRSGAGRVLGLVPWPRFPFVRALPPGLQDQLTDAFTAIHQAFVWTMLALLCLHVAGVLKHQFIQRDGTLSRMAPWTTGRRRAAVRTWLIPATATAAVALAWAPAPLPQEVVRPRPASTAQADLYMDVVAPTLQNHCASCHNDEKSRGGLSFANYPALMEGGASGHTVTPGDAAHSLLYRRITLPAADAHFMPQGGHRPLTPEQAQAIAWWIGQGAPASLRLAKLDMPADIQAAVGVALGFKAAHREDPLSGLPVVTAAAPEAIARAEAAGFVVRPVALGSHLLDVDITSNRQVGPQELAALAGLADQIHGLNLRGAGLTDASLQVIGKAPHLAKLRLEGNAITDGGLGSLEQLKELEAINVSQTRVTAAGLERLANLPRLQRIYAWSGEDGAHTPTLSRNGRPILVVSTRPNATAGNLGPTSPAQEAAAKSLIAGK